MGSKLDHRSYFSLVWPSIFFDEIYLCQSKLCTDDKNHLRWDLNQGRNSTDLSGTAHPGFLSRTKASKNIQKYWILDRRRNGTKTNALKSTGHTSVRYFADFACRKMYLHLSPLWRQKQRASLWVHFGFNQSLKWMLWLPYNTYWQIYAMMTMQLALVRIRMAMASNQHEYIVFVDLLLNCLQLQFHAYTARISIKTLLTHINSSFISIQMLHASCILSSFWDCYGKYSQPRQHFQCKHFA